MVKLEIATVKYTEYGEYDYTIESDWKTFETDEQARKYVLESLTPSVDKNMGYEYYFYKDNEEDYYDCIIENDYFNRYTLNASYVLDNKYFEDFIGNYKSIEDAKEEIKIYIEENKEYIEDYGVKYNFEIYDNEKQKIVYETKN